MPLSPAPARRTRPVGAVAALILGLFAFLGLGAVGVAAAPAASAHSVLVSSDPADGAELSAMPDNVTFTFNEDINPNFAQVIVNSGGIARKSSGVTVSGPKVIATVPEDVTPGTVTALYRVTSADGHPVEGKITFTVPGGTSSAPATGTPGAATTPSAEATSAASAATRSAQGAQATADGGNIMMIALTVVAAIVLVVVGVLLLRAERRRH